jgi:hypothetical protein
LSHAHNHWQVLGRFSKETLEEADIALGNRERGAYCLIELEDAGEDSIVTSCQPTFKGEIAVVTFQVARFLPLGTNSARIASRNLGGSWDDSLCKWQTRGAPPARAAGKVVATLPCRRYNSSSEVLAAPPKSGHLGKIG